MAADRRGATAVMAALAMTVMMGFAGVAVDIGLWQANKRDMQGAADQAAYTAAVASNATGITGSSSGSCTAPCVNAKAIAAKMGYADGSSGTTVVVNNPPTQGASAGAGIGWEVIVRKPQPMWFARFFLASAPTVTARAVALLNPGACMIALDPSASQALKVGGNGTISMPCDIYVNSTSSDGTDVQGSSAVSGKDIYLVGNYQVGGSGSISATNKFKTGASPITDPYANRTMPTPGACAAIPTTNPISPGTYCGALNFPGGTLTMSPGVYFLSRSNLALGNNRLTGSGVTIILTDITCASTTSCPSVGSVTMGGNANLNLTAMSTGATAGIAIWIDKRAPSNSSVSMGGGSNMNVNGAIYAPNSKITYQGGTAANTYCSQLIGRTISLQGNPYLAHTCSGLGLTEPQSSSIAMSE